MMRRAMRARLGWAVAVALLILVIAVTPLSAFLSGGVFEIWLPGDQFITRTRVVLEDHTGLVRGIAPAYPDQMDDGVSALGRDGRTLFVQWMGGCGDPLTVLTFDRADVGYRIDERTEHHCMFLIGIGHAVTVSLWSPVDAATLTFVPHDSGS